MSEPHHPDRHFVVGVIILVLGVVLLLDQLGFSLVEKFWPLILIYFGMRWLLTSHHLNGRFWGGFLTLVGIIFELQELGYSRIRFDTIWPAFLICIGVLLLLRRYEGRRRWGYYEPPPAPPPGPPASDAQAPTAPGSQSTAGAAPEAQPAASGSPPPQSAPYEQPRPQSNFGPAWGPPPWQNDPSWQKFQRRMERLDERMNRVGERMNWKWQQHQSRSEPGYHWQPSSNWRDSSEPRLDEVNVFWGGRRRILSKNFQGGEIVAICGGFEIDLTAADFQANQIVIEVVTIFGGGEIRVPPNWEVLVDSVGIFGGTADRTNHPSAQTQNSSGSSAPPTRRLVIKGVSVFGGLTLKN